MNSVRICIAWPVLLACFWTGTLFGEVSVGELFDIAPEVEDTVFQKWPRAAWAVESKCWLVVWREGDLNRQETDIWCARVKEDGTPMDPAGIRLTSAKRVQDKPVVASDGNGFLVSWQDLRDGADTSEGAVRGWDVYAARVSADGKVSDPDGFLVSGGPHNQCLPTVVFCGKNYYLAWQSWVEDAIQPEFGSYKICGARISPNGKVLDAEAIDLVKPTAMLPTLAYHPEGGLVAVFIGRVSTGRKFIGFTNYPGFVRIDPEKGGALGAAAYIPRNNNTSNSNYPPGVALMKDGSSLVNVVGWRGGMTLFKYDKNGKRIGEWQRFRKDPKNQCIVMVTSMASDGENTLMTFDFPSKHETIAKERGDLCMKIWGWKLSADGTILDGGKTGFPIAARDDVDSVQGIPCVGPSGTFLVVYNEMRGLAKTTVVGRLVR